VTRGERARVRNQRGAGLLPAVFGVAIVVGFLGFAAHIAIGLWVRSTVDSVAYDVARRVASAPPGSPASMIESDAIEDGLRSLGAFGREVALRFEPDTTDVVLHVAAPGFSLLPPIVDAGPVIGEIDRTIVIRRELG
jgi:hypothetical protein